MNYTVTVTAGNVLGESSPVSITGETVSTSTLVWLIFIVKPVMWLNRPPLY